MITRREALAAGAASLATTLTASPLRAGQSLRSTDGRIRLADGRWLAYREYGQPTGPLVLYFHGTPGSRLELGLCDDESCLSGGAPYATVCAARIPHRLTHVALVSGHAPLCAPGTCPGNQDDLVKLVSRRPRLAKLAFRLIDRRLDRKPHKVVQKIAKNWAAADRREILCNPKQYRRLVANMNEATRCGPAGLVKDIRLLSCHWGFDLSEIQGVPVSIWQGGCDRIVTPSMAHYFQEQIAGSQLAIDPRAGHVTMFKWHAEEILSQFSS